MALAARPTLDAILSAADRAEIAVAQARRRLEESGALDRAPDALRADIDRAWVALDNPRHDTRAAMTYLAALFIGLLARVPEPIDPLTGEPVARPAAPAPAPPQRRLRPVAVARRAWSHAAATHPEDHD